MKRSTADAGQPPRQPEIFQIPVFNRSPNQEATTRPQAPLPPTMTTVQRPAVAVWQVPDQAVFTFWANQAYPPGPPGQRGTTHTHAPLPPTITNVQQPAVAVWPEPSQAFFTFSANHPYPPGPSGQGASTHTHAPLPPTITNVQQPAVAVWPEPSQATFTFSANQAYPPGPPGLPATPPTFHDFRSSTERPSIILRSREGSSPTGRYALSQVAGKTELIVRSTTADDLIELADTLRRPTTVTKIIVEVWQPQELKATFDAIRTSVAVLDLEIFYLGEPPKAGELSSLFSVFQEHQLPIKSFKWISKQNNTKPLKIDQAVIEALLASKSLERIDFSAPPDKPLTFVSVNDANRLVQCIQKHPSLKSLSLKRLNGAPFINAILNGVAMSPIIEELKFDQTNLEPCTKALQSAVNNNKRLRSISIKDCPLALGAMTQLLNAIYYHPAIKSVDFNTAKIPNQELNSIGEPIGKLLLANAQITALRFPCALSPENIASLKVGLDANTSLEFLGMEVFEDANNNAFYFTGTNTSAHLRDMFLSNKGLREILIRLSDCENGLNEQLLDSIAKSTSIESLTIENLSAGKPINHSLAHNDSIKHLNLKMKFDDHLDMEFGVKRLSQEFHTGEGLENLANELSDNKNLLSFNLTVGPNEDPQRILNIEYSPLDKAIQKVRDITTRNRVRNMATLAGAVMSRRQDLMPNVPGAIPPLTREINRMIFEATLDNLAPGDAKKIYDTVLPFTPLPGNQ